MPKAWLMLAFPDPLVTPPDGYREAKSGKSWYLKLPTRADAIDAKRLLIAAGIRYSCKKVDDPPPARPYNRR
jgi:hypothetical protein